MYRSGKDYDEIAKVIIEIYKDYGIKGLPVYAQRVCRLLGVSLVPYSAFNPEQAKLLLRKSKHGFFVRGTSANPPTIFYNDRIQSKGSIRFTIFHELKHYIFEDKDDEADDLADYFSRYFMCPIPYLMLKNIDSPSEVVSVCYVSMEAAENVCLNIKNRERRYGSQIFDYEINLIEQMDPILLEVNRIYK